MSCVSPVLPPVVSGAFVVGWPRERKIKRRYPATSLGKREFVGVLFTQHADLPSIKKFHTYISIAI